MKRFKQLSVIFLIIAQQSFGQQTTPDRQEIISIINNYSKSIIEKDSTTFFGLFNNDAVTWCAALKDRSRTKEIEKKGIKAARRNYFSGSYQTFMRSLFRYKSTEDKFDNIRIIEDGTVASVSMDYSFWADYKMTNWGGKYLTLIKRDGKWKITSVIYSLELTDYFEQPPPKRKTNRYLIREKRFPADRTIIRAKTASLTVFLAGILYILNNAFTQVPTGVYLPPRCPNYL